LAEAVRVLLRSSDGRKARLLFAGLVALLLLANGLIVVDS
jgi:hypothetical protein